MRKDIHTSPQRETGAHEGSLFAWPRFDVDYTVEPYDDTPDIYTFYPREASDEEIITQWVSAGEDSVVDITAIR